ncbi:MAG: GNAT family N-acetyltransferase [Prevotella sp.]|nr:GNAT family N-acetyltransferase [Prevotella sp.]
MNIRLETPQDYREVENLTREAFWNVYRPGCTEHYVLNKYRNNPDFIPELDFVMEEDGKIIGHVMFSKAEIVLDENCPIERLRVGDGTSGMGRILPAWTFGPISIHPDYKRKGYGLKLLNYAIGKARELGIGVLCMEGNIDFYKHAGFDLASKLNIHYHDMPKDDEVPFFLAQELKPGYLKGIRGTYCPPKGYFVADENPEAFEAYDKTFPKKTKEYNEGQLPPFAEKAKLVLQSERLTLRPWFESDADTLFKYASDPEVGPRAGWAPHKSIEESLEVIRNVFNRDTTTWAIVLKETNEVIGAMGYGASCDCKLPIREGEPIVGYWVAKPYWNNGYCTEALQLMLDHIHTTTDIPSLCCGHFVDNPASGRVMEKCGFVPTGEECFDETLYGGKDRPIRVLRLEW